MSSQDPVAMAELHQEEDTLAAAEATDPENPPIEVKEGNEHDTNDVQQNGEEEEENEEEDVELKIPLLNSPDSSPLLTDSQRLLTSKNVKKMSLFALRLGVLADSVNTTILRPSYPFLVIPPEEGGFSDAFPSTAPFDFGAAQYFLPMSALLGTALAATFVGNLSDKIGRRPVFLVCVAFGVIGSIAKYLARGSFWAFCGCNFVTGLFGATLAVSMAYASDVSLTRSETDGIIGSLMGISMLGATGGGIMAIAMSDVGLFEPLLFGSALNLVAAIFAYVYLIEPDRMLQKQMTKARNDDSDNESNDDHTAAATEDGTNDGESPDHLDLKITSNILIGSLLDNAGSTGYIPFCLSPLMFNTYLKDLVANGETPIMSENAYRWIGTMLAIMIIPAAASSAKLYQRIGAPAGCVLGNAFTGAFTIILLLIATRIDASVASYATYITVMYLGFPLTIISQLSTGPMLDRISPASRRGFTQGLNTTVMNLGQAMFPWIFGLLSDDIGVETTIWICIGISFSAAIVNMPLLFVTTLKPVPAVVKMPEYGRSIHGEDQELIDRALRGEWVSPFVLHEINDRRLKDGHQFLVVPYKTYEEDKKAKNLCTISKHSNEDFKFMVDLMTGYLQSDCLRDPLKRKAVVKKISESRPPKEKRDELANDLGQWFADYMVDAGYQIDDSPFVLKQMVMSAFPRIMKSSDHNELTPENLEQVTLNFIQVYNHFMEEEKNAPHIQAFAGTYAYS